jgi:hypothetical protein
MYTYIIDPTYRSRLSCIITCFLHTLGQVIIYITSRDPCPQTIPSWNDWVPIVSYHGCFRFGWRTIGGIGWYLFMANCMPTSLLPWQWGEKRAAWFFTVPWTQSREHRTRATVRYTWLVAQCASCPSIFNSICAGGWNDLDFPRRENPQIRIIMW